MFVWVSIFVCVHSAGKERLSSILGVSAEEASRVQDNFLQKYKEVQTFIQYTVQHCHKYGACLWAQLVTRSLNIRTWGMVYSVNGRFAKNADGGC